MTQVKEGDTVKVHYTGKLSDGSVFDSSMDREPLEFTLGRDQVIPGFEEAVTGMSPGEKKTAEISPEKAYGARHDEMVVEVPKEEFPDHIRPQVGQQLEIQQPGGQSIVVIIAEITESSVKLDGNHPLAGQDLTFEIELVEVA